MPQPAEDLYPLLFAPVYMPKVWGGARIAERYRRPAPRQSCGESWEIADRPEGMSVVSNGPLAGRPLHALVEDMPAALIGATATATVFPLLIKIIDAKERLSVQVHPDDHAAARFGGEAKSEVWVILDAPPGAEILAGLRPKTDRAAFETALTQGRLDERLHRQAVHPGEVYHIPGGRVHAIGAGCLLLEVQQNSDTTYRVYDWDRVSHAGTPRALHIEDALKVVNWHDGPASAEPAPLRRDGANKVWELLSTPHFRMHRLELTEKETFCNDGRSFHALFVLANPLDVRGGAGGERLECGTSCLLPAGLSEYTLRPLAGRATVLRIDVP